MKPNVESLAVSAIPFEDGKARADFGSFFVQQGNHFFIRHADLNVGAFFLDLIAASGQCDKQNEG